MMKYVLTMVLVMAAIILVQTGLSGLVGFHTAELLGKTAMSALFWFSIIRLIQEVRRART